MSAGVSTLSFVQLIVLNLSVLKVPPRRGLHAFSWSTICAFVIDYTGCAEWNILQATDGSGNAANDAGYLQALWRRARGKLAMGGPEDAPIRNLHLFPFQMNDVQWDYGAVTESRA